MNKYQELILDYYIDNIYKCNAFKRGMCLEHLTDTTNSIYKHGPELAFVGNKYGTVLPKLLFTRTKPPWKSDFGWFGTKESIDPFVNNKQLDNIFDKYTEGVRDGDKEFRGLLDRGTITGYKNEPKLSVDEISKRRKNPKYGVNSLLRELIKLGELPYFNGKEIEFCAVNNIVNSPPPKGGGFG